MSWMFLTATAWASPGDVLINEVLYDGVGTDDGQEWIELCNPGSSTIDLTGWTIQSAGSTFGDDYTFKSGSIAPGDYLVVGAGSKEFPAALAFQNGGSESDGIRLTDDSSAVVDTVLYDSPNTNGLFDDGGAAGTSLAVDVGEGTSLARVVDCHDTDASAVDFAKDDTPSPGAANSEATGDTGDTGDTGTPPPACDGASVIRINEIVNNPSGSDGDAEWLELVNTSGSAVDVSGWEIEWGTSSFSSSEALPGGTMVPAHGYLVVGGSLVPESDVVVSLDMGNASSSGDGVRLSCLGTPIDTVIYGPDNSDAWVDDSGGVATSIAPTPVEGESIGRSPDGVDTDASGVDFIGWPFPTPGAKNAEGSSTCPGQNDVKINEVLPAPDGDDAGNEWVELYNRGTDPVSLEGWMLQWGTSSYSSEYAFEKGASIEPGGFFLVGGEFVSGADAIADLAMGNATSSSDSVRLVHCGGAAADTVIYGDPNSDLWLDDAGSIAASMAISPGDGHSIARTSDGIDTDQCGTDFVETDAPTPGASNPYSEPPVCQPDTGVIKINEFIPDPDSSDTDYEWVELINTSSEAFRLDGWTLETGTSDWGTDYTFESGSEIEAGGFVVVGGGLADNVDFVADSLSLGNVSRAPDGVRILDCVGTVADTVLWGDDGQDIEDFDLLDDLGGQSMAVMPISGFTVGRIPDGLDTDDNASDFVSNMTPTPGAANTAGTSNGGNGVGKGCGCGKKDTSGGPSKCSTLPGDASVLWLAALAVVGIRRRALSGAGRSPTRPVASGR